MDKLGQGFTVVPGNMGEEHLSPTVLWAQRKHFVLLRVQVKSLEVNMQSCGTLPIIIFITGSHTLALAREYEGVASEWSLDAVGPRAA